MNISMIVDLAWGSTGKGLLAGYIAERDRPDTLVCAFAPNAGHTSYLRDGTKLIHKMLPNGVNSDRLRNIFIGPGAVIDWPRMQQEIYNLQKLGLLPGVNIYVHANAAVVLSKHVAQEASFARIGSTQTGAGMALVQKIMRDPDDDNTAAALADQFVHPAQVVTDQVYLEKLAEAEVMLIEGAQGFGLSIHHGYYPYVTSRDVTPMQILADCGIPWKQGRHAKVIGSTRTYPIRVNNKSGSSGPCYPDQQETSFEAVGQQVELTTVTKLPRRIFTFSEQQMNHACRACSPNEVFLNFGNYCRSLDELKTIVASIERHSVVRYVGFGPRSTDIVDRLSDHGAASMLRAAKSMGWLE